MNSFIRDSADGDSFFKKLLPVFFSPAYVNQDRFRIFTDFFIQNGTSFSKDVLIAQMRAVREWIESKSWVKGCPCPCIFIYGSEDQLITRENTKNELAASFSKSEVKIIDGAGHAVHIEKYREFNNVVHEFLTRQKL
jgi:pimeloyl-ACP methyl ester carboxylesterase